MASQFARGNHAEKCMQCGSFIPDRERVICSVCGKANFRYTGPKAKV